MADQVSVRRAEGIGPYYGDVPAGRCEAGETTLVSPEKAAQLLRDFPRDWIVAPPPLTVVLEPVSEPPAPAEGAAVPEPTPTPEPTPEMLEAALDALIALPGIGRAYATRLISAGLLTREDVLAEENAAKVAEILPDAVLAQVRGA